MTKPPPNPKETASVAIPTEHPDIYAIRDASPLFRIWPWAKGPLWRLAKEWRFSAYDYAAEMWREYVIPEGYEFDKASIPPVFWGPPFYFTPDGLYTTAALEHDFLCDCYAGGSDWLKNALGGKVPAPLKPLSIHSHFYYRMLEYGVPKAQAELFFTGVREFGPGGKWFVKHLWNKD